MISLFSIAEKKIIISLISDFSNSIGMKENPDSIDDGIIDELLFRSISLSQSYSDIFPELSRLYILLFVILILIERLNSINNQLVFDKFGMKYAVKLLYNNRQAIDKISNLDFDILIALSKS